MSLSSQQQEGKRQRGDKEPYGINNKHENLFCCGRRGVNFLILNTSQFLYVLTILFIALKSCGLMDEISKINGDTTKIVVHSILIAFAFVFALLAWFWIIPSILTSFTITTNIEMMKDRDCMHRVIQIQRMDRSKRSFRIYQVLKLIRREMLIEFRKQIPDMKLNKEMQGHVIEQFLLCGSPDPRDTHSRRIGPIIRNEQIFSLIRLCAGSSHMTKEECFIFMKKIHVN